MIEVIKEDGKRISFIVDDVKQLLEGNNGMAAVVLNIGDRRVNVWTQHTYQELKELIYGKEEP